MQEEEIEMVGNFCREVLDHPLMRRLNHEWEVICSQRMLNTTPTQTALRDEAYNSFRGAKEFLDYMNSFVQQQESLQQEREQHAQVAEEAGLSPNMLPDEEVILGDDLRFEE